MAQPQQKTQQKQVKAPAAERKQPVQEEKNEMIVRIFGYDVPGSRNIYAGLTRIKGISWAISNAVCLQLNMPRSIRVGDLSKEDIAKIESFLSKITIPDFMKNRRFDPESGQTSHIYGSNLEVTKEFDVKKLKKMKSYRGFRHTYGQPSRGQKTRSHFRKSGRGVGIKRTKK